MSEVVNEVVVSTARDAVMQVLQDISAKAAQVVVPDCAKLESNKTAKDRWGGLVVGPDFVMAANEWVDVKSIDQDIEDRLESAKKSVVDLILPIFADRIFLTKSKPSNPVVCLSNAGKTQHRFQIWLTANFTLHFSKQASEKHTEMAYVEEFQQFGLSLAAAAQIVSEEIRIETVRNLRDLSELRSGSFGKTGEWLDSSEIEKRAYNKIDAWLNWSGQGDPPEALSDHERDVATVKKNVVLVRPGFLDRCHQYASSPADILAIWNLIRPVVFPTRLEFGLSDTDDEVRLRKLHVSSQIFG